jgi:sugar O-acyltransferase (sialic acid O-acetyltransferase NeuD family)
MVKNLPSVVLGIYGAGGFGREIVEIANQSLVKIIGKDVNYKIYFIESSPKMKEINGYTLITEEEFFSIKCNNKYFNIAISNSKVREQFANRFLQKGIEPISIYSLNAEVSKNVDISVGSIICSFSTLTSNIKIGKFFHANLYSLISHDCVIGDFVTFAPGVSCLGNVHINDHAYVGAGAILKQGSTDKPLVIGEGAIIGMGAVVTKDVAPFTTVVGIPARIL